MQEFEVWQNTNKWYIHNPESVLENETHQLLWDFVIQAEQQISVWWPNLIIINNKKTKKKKKGTCRIAVPVDLWVKMKVCEKRDKYHDLCKGIEKAVEHESDVYANCNWCSWDNHKRISTRTEGLGNDRMSWDYPNYCITENDQNTEESSGESL